ncbi:glycoside hydrolase domain-containing protein [Terribacillus saccharophilus]|uniref:glycoside hydrolase domain-containing protein n=1 Tax=Terribacillus saccharophilus TaxID=361277 RepID=UPI0006906B80|nr:glycoside hydrolase domain-containing protein [Terribacillus goriensis]
MADEMLRQTQIWLNKTYSGVNGFNKVPEDGQTRNKTYYGLIRAVQIELGITNLADSFGPATELAFKALFKQGEKAEPRNLNYILQGGFWTKGYSPGGFNGMFLDDTESAVKRFQRDIGIEPTGVVTAQVMKALLNTDGYTLSSQGTSDMRTVQQFLNATYGGKYFTYIPTNGVYERNTNKALIYGLQAEMGMSTSVANGNFGPGTTNGCPVLYEGDSGNNVKLLQGALLGNGYDTIGILGLDGRFDSGLKSKVIQFQKDLVLPQTGIADMPTIKQLLSSAGHTGRSATVCDTATILNTSNIQTVINNGYKMVGRYLTGTVGGTLSKALTDSELNLIFSKGLKVFPIYQDGGYYSDYFVSGQGNIDANKALAAARALGFPSGTTIYFAVDFDAYDFEVKNKILPYFNEIFSTFAELKQYNGVPDYKIGIYGPRNSCIQVANAGYADNSFVSNMSTGFSGNLGFPMPNNWSFSQFFEQTIYSGTNTSIPIDKVDTSGRDQGVSAVTPPKDLEEDVLRQAWTEVGSRLPFVSTTPYMFSTEFIFDKSFRVIEMATLSVDVVVSRVVKLGESNNAVTVQDGKIGLSVAVAAEETQTKLSSSRLDTAQGFLDNLALGIGNGEIEVESKIVANGLEMKLIGKKFDLPSSVGSNVALQVAVTITFSNVQLPSPMESLKKALEVTTFAVAAFAVGYATLQTGGLALPVVSEAAVALLAFLGLSDDESDDDPT